jgi:ribose 5-phosphate isomerase RpiB
MVIGFAIDHGGYVLKEFILKALSNPGHEVRGFGSYRLNPAGQRGRFGCI